MGGSLSPKPHPDCFSPFGIQTHCKIFWIANCILECNWLFIRELQTANCILKTNCRFSGVVTHWKINVDLKHWKGRGVYSTDISGFCYRIWLQILVQPVPVMLLAVHSWAIIVNNTCYSYFCTICTWVNKFKSMNESPAWKCIEVQTVNGINWYPVVINWTIPHPNVINRQDSTPPCNIHAQL